MKTGAMTAGAMVVTPQPEATEAGVDVLRAGGSAVDAAIASGLVQSVVDPLMCGIAGFGSAAIRLPGQAHRYCDFHSPAPALVRADMWENLIEGEARDGWGFHLTGRVNEIGYQSVGVPATLCAFAEMHRAHGRLPWAELFAPAIAYAEAGWTVRPHTAAYWSSPGVMGRASGRDRISNTPAAKALYCRPDGSPKQLGEIVRNRDYATVLRLIARDGADAMVQGEIADAIEADMKANAGLLRCADLLRYRPRWLPPLQGTYRGFNVTTNQPPGGGIMLLQMLNTLEHFDLPALGHNSAAYVQVVAEAMKAATRDKDLHVGDPDFVAVPVERLTSKDYAAGLAAAIKDKRRFDVPRLQAGLPSKDTTQVTVVDAEGGCVSMTHSLGIPSGVVSPGLGFMYNGCMSVFDPRPGRAGSIGPGKSRFSSICPSIILRDDALVLAIGAPGATQIVMGVLQVVLNVLDHGMPIVEAVCAPRFSATSNAIDVSNRIPRAVERTLAEDGYEVVRSPLSYTFGWVHGIEVTSAGLAGGADPATDGYALSS
jgi:gamma-glutamyltranspeptidase/glutathione hydrolase